MFTPSPVAVALCVFHSVGWDSGAINDGRSAVQSISFRMTHDEGFSILLNIFFSHFKFALSLYYVAVYCNPARHTY
jgi:hypothetical protein